MMASMQLRCCLCMFTFSRVPNLILLTLVTNYVLFIILYQLPRHKNIKLAVRERKMKNFWCVNVSRSSCQSFDDKKAALSFQSMLDEHPSTEMAAKDNKPVRDDKWDKFYIYVMAWEKDNNHKKDWRWTNSNLKDNDPFRSLDTYN